MRSGKRWEEHEDNFLFENVGKKTIEYMSKKIGRSRCGIYTRMYNLGICKTVDASGMYTICQIAEALGKDNKSVWKWCVSKMLRSRTKKLSLSKRVRLVSAKDVWRFVENNKDKINFKNIKRKLIIPEPKWLDNVILNETRSMRYHQKWTPEEDKKLQLLFNQGKSYLEICQEMQRNYAGITHRLSRLKKNRKISLRWTPEEIAVLTKMEQAGSSDAQIAYALGRERAHIVDKRRRL